MPSTSYLFVYGTLQQGQSNHHQIQTYKRYLGTAVILHKKLLELGSYPGLVEERQRLVLGELYEVDNDLLPILDRFEGSQYQRKSETVYQNYRAFDAYYYEFIGDEHDYPEFNGRGKWGSDESYCWYATYGSNLSLDRFLKYINQTSSQQPPLLVETTVINHPLYFAKSSSTWDNKGVAFVDLSEKGFTHSAMYLITELQFKEIWDAEGSWYDSAQDLGERFGYPIKTITSKNRYPENPPSENYLKVIAYGLQEHINLTSEYINTYLNSDFTLLDIDIKHLLRNI